MFSNSPVVSLILSDFSLPDSLIPLPNPVSHIEMAIRGKAEVYEALTQLDPSKAIGLDGIGPKILGNCTMSL